MQWELEQRTPRHGDRPSRSATSIIRRQTYGCLFADRAAAGRPWLSLLTDAYSRRLSVVNSHPIRPATSAMMIVRERVHRHGRPPQMGLDGGKELTVCTLKHSWPDAKVEETRPPAGRASVQHANVCRLPQPTRGSFITGRQHASRSQCSADDQELGPQDPCRVALTDLIGADGVRIQVSTEGIASAWAEPARSLEAGLAATGNRPSEYRTTATS